jgi:5-methylcytosine-specific restriction endonuclease McrA
MPDGKITKRCSKCKVAKPLSDFYRRRRSKDGHQAFCKRCNLQSASAWIKSHPETRVAWRKSNVVRERETNAAWRRANPARVARYGAKYVRTHRDKIKQKLARRRAIKRHSTVDPKGIAAFYRMVRTAERITCYWCSKPVKKSDRHVDHIVPLARGGAHAVLNLCCSCSSCNHRKRHKLPAEFTGQHELFA